MAEGESLHGIPSGCNCGCGADREERLALVIDDQGNAELLCNGAERPICVCSPVDAVTGEPCR